MEKKKVVVSKKRKVEIDNLYREIDKKDLRNATGGLAVIRAQFAE